MNRHLTALSETHPDYADCLVSSVLKKVFLAGNKVKENSRLVVASQIAAVKKELEQLNHQEPIELSYAFLEAMEQTLKDVQFRYAVVYKDNRPVLFASFQIFTLSSQNFNLQQNKGFVKHIMRFFLDLKTVNVMMSGNALRNNITGCCYNELIIGQTEAAELLVSLAEKIAADENISALVLKDIAFKASQKRWLGKLGFGQPQEDMEMVM